MATVASGVDTAELGSWQNERWYQGGGRVGEKAVERITIYPPTRGCETQGDPFEPVKIGILVDMDIGQLLADWIDATILAIEDAMNEGVYDRPVEIITVDARGLPRENYLKVRKGYQKLVDEGCVVVLGPMISDNSVNLRDTINDDRRRLHRLDGRGALLRRLLLHRRERRHPRRVHDVRQLVLPGGVHEGRLLLGEGLVGHRLLRLLPARRAERRRRDHQGGVARPEPARPRAPARHDARAGRAGDRLRGLRLLDVPLRPCVQGARLGPAAHHGHGVHVLFELERVGRGRSRAGTASTSSARTARTRTTRRCSSGSTPASGASRATSSWPWPTTPPAPASTASPTRSSPRRTR